MSQKDHKSELDVYKYLLKVVEEMSLSACPQDLIQKYQKLKQISFQKFFTNTSNNSSQNNSNYSTQQQIFPPPQNQQNNNQLIQNFLNIIQIICSNPNQILEQYELQNLIENNINSIQITDKPQQQKIIQSIQEIFSLQQQYQQLKLQSSQLNNSQTSNNFSNNNQQQQQQQIQQQQELQEENKKMKEKLEELRREHFQSVKMQEDEYKKIITEINSQLQQQQQQSQSQDNLDEYKELSDKFEEIFSPYIQKYHESFQQFSQSQHQQKETKNNTLLLQFIHHLFQKFESDNLYLVEKLSELSQQNQNVQQNIKQYQQQCEQGQQVIDMIYNQLKHDLDQGKQTYQDYEHSKNQLQQLLNHQQQQQQSV